jgi:hypothetical protein
MPNWTSNVLDVTFRGGKKGKTQLDAFHKKVYRLVKNNEGHLQPFFDFNGTVPMPEELIGTSSPAYTPEEKERAVELTKKYGVGDWFAFQHKFWGVKWGACDGQLPEISLKSIQYQFETPWTVPLPWLEATAKQFPLLTFRDQARFDDSGAILIKVYTKTGAVEVEQTNCEEHKWKIKFDKDYKKVYDFIVHGDYAKVIKRYSGADLNYYYTLAPYLIKRIKRQDLPLFLEFDWGKNQGLFTSKLKGDKNVESISK